MWLHVTNCRKGAVAYLYRELGITGIMFCHQTGGPITQGGIMQAGGLITGILRYSKFKPYHFGAICVLINIPAASIR